VAHLLDLLRHLKTTSHGQDDVFKVTRRLIAGVDLAEPVADAVALSLADHIAKAGKKDRPQMLAMLRTLVDQPDMVVKKRRYEALFATADAAILGLFVVGINFISLLYSI
jgi:hypothetical protein